MTTAILLGAGASSEDGLPLQRDLLPGYFARHSHDQDTALNSDVGKFLDRAFGIKQFQKQEKWAIPFPTPEEIFGVLDLALSHQQALTASEEEDDPLDLASLRRARQGFLYLIVKSIADPSTSPKQPIYHQRLIENLGDALRDVIFVTTNYDGLLDYPLHQLKIPVEYGVGFMNYRPAVLAQNRGIPATRLLKIHGSVNWLYCSACNLLSMTPFRPQALDRINRTDWARCAECSRDRELIIVPPSPYKVLNQLPLSCVWKQAVSLIPSVDRVIVSGYSFSDADSHVRYLIKRAQLLRGRDLPILVLNKDPHDTRPVCDQETEYVRLRRFFGSGIQILDASFRDLANNPRDFLASPKQAAA